MGTLSKLMDGANKAQYKEMLHVLKFVLETKTCGLKFLLLNEKIWKLEGISDVNFASDKERHISVMGYVFYLWALAKPQTQRHCDFNYRTGIHGIIRDCDHIEAHHDGITINGD